MRNIETLKTKVGPDDAGLNEILTEARMEERRGRADVMAARMEVMACHIVSREMPPRLAAELLRQEAEKIRNEAMETY